MNTVRHISLTFARLADRMMGQEVERAGIAKERGHGSDLAAVTQAHYARQGVSPLGFGR